LTGGFFVDTIFSMKGRPKKPAAERRGNFLRIRMTDAERAALDEAAQARGLETSTWARMVLLGLARKPPKK
jgi:hypothetical protein